MNAPILTDEVATRIESALANAAESRARHVQRLPGNPLGLAIRHWGHLRGILVRQDLWYYRYFNASRNVRAGDEARLDEVLTWYRDHGALPRIAISPFLADDQLLRHLAVRGLRHSGFLTVLFGQPEAWPLAPPTDVRIQVDDASAPDMFLDLWLTTAPEGEQAFLRPIVQAEFAEWRLYVAFVDEQPAAVGALYLDAGIGTLAAAATLPEFRGRGCQTALLRRRIADAHAAGCDLVICQAAPGSVSQRNMERVGLRTAYTQAIWSDR